MSSKRFIQHPTALQASAMQPQRAGKQEFTGQLFSFCPQDTLANTQVNAQGNPMTILMPQTTPCAAQGAQAPTAAVCQQAVAVAAVVANGPVAGVHEIAEPCMPQAQAQQAQIEVAELDMCWHTQELFVGTENNIELLPCLGLLGDDIDFPGPPEPGGRT